MTPREEQFGIFRVVSNEELPQNFGEYSAKDDLYAIHNWPDAKFTTSEGRAFLLFIGTESIFYRLKAASAAIGKKLPPWEGAIFEIDTEDEPFVFRTLDDCALAWAQFHAIHGVPMAPEECELLDLELPEETDEE